MTERSVALNYIIRYTPWSWNAAVIIYLVRRVVSGRLDVDDRTVPPNVIFLYAHHYTPSVHSSLCVILMGTPLKNACVSRQMIYSFRATFRWVCPKCRRICQSVTNGVLSGYVYQWHSQVLALGCNPWAEIYSVSTYCIVATSNQTFF